MIAHQDTKPRAASVLVCHSYHRSHSCTLTVVQVVTPGASIPRACSGCAPYKSPPGPCKFEDSCPAGKVLTCCDTYTGDASLNAGTGTLCTPPVHTTQLGLLTVPRLTTHMQRRNSKRRSKLCLCIGCDCCLLCSRCWSTPGFKRFCL